MRNWNFHPLITQSKIFVCFYSTYEELKLYILQTLCFGEPVFTVPMRNWNLSKYILTLKCFDGFYSTYEELKHFLLYFFAEFY